MNQGEIRRCKIHRRINVLRNGADVYVIIGIIAFVAGVIFTVICIRLRDRKAHKQQE